METITYSRVGSLEIQIDLHMPQNLPHGARPAIVHYHGGGMIGGCHSALEHGILFISADYRLLMPSTAFEIIEDVKSLFTFLASPDFSEKYLPDGITLDCTHIAVSGESGGGYPARAAGIFAQPKPAAILLQYAMGGQLLDDHWLAVKDSPMQSAENVTSEAFAALLTRPQDPISYDPMPLLGDESVKGDSKRCMLLLLWWEKGELLDRILGVELSARLRDLPLSERADAVPRELRLALLQTQLEPSFPPTYLIHGKEDMLILPAESEHTWKQLTDLGVETQLHLLDAAGHSLMDAQNPSELASGAKALQAKAVSFLLDRLI